MHHITAVKHSVIRGLPFALQTHSPGQGLLLVVTSSCILNFYHIPSWPPGLCCLCLPRLPFSVRLGAVNTPASLCMQATPQQMPAVCRLPPARPCVWQQWTAALSAGKCPTGESMCKATAISNGIYTIMLANLIYSCACMSMGLSYVGM